MAAESLRPALAPSTKDENMPDMKELLRSLPSLPGPYVPFDTAQAPAQPEPLFAQWLQAAIDAGIREPHAMTLSTVDADGCPDARVLILKNIDEHGWHFAISRASPKGRQISGSPQVALTFYWPALGRQVRIRGTAHDMGEQASSADFLARPLGSRAGALLARQSDVLASQEELEDGLARQLRRLEQQPDLLPDSWVDYAFSPREIEFWQGSEQRRHVRLRYCRAPDASWSKERLWP
jgi:pyridoxamine 5'-phosphate oxidase